MSKLTAKQKREWDEWQLTCKRIQETTRYDKKETNGEKIKSYEQFSKATLETCLRLSEKTFDIWKHVEIPDRTKLLKTLSKNLIKNKQSYSELMTQEMGKPISQSMAEIEKCAFLVDFYAKNADQFLADELIKTDAEESFISYDPLGCILGIMPWNYPFWQVFRFVAPALMAGNVGRAFLDKTVLVDALYNLIIEMAPTQTVTILFKGSRSAQMEQAIALLTEKLNESKENTDKERKC